MQKRNEEWLLQLVNLLKDEKALLVSLTKATSKNQIALITHRLNEVLDKKRAYEHYEILAVYELLNPIIDETKLFDILTKASKFAKEKRKVVIRIARGKPSNDDTFNDFLMALILFIVSKDLAFTTLITALLFAEKTQTLTYKEEEITIKVVNNQGGNYD